VCRPITRIESLNYANYSFIHSSAAQITLSV